MRESNQNGADWQGQKLDAEEQDILSTTQSVCEVFGKPFVDVEEARIKEILHMLSVLCLRVEERLRGNKPSREIIHIPDEDNRKIKDWAHQQHRYWHNELPSAAEEDILCAAMGVSLTLGIALAGMSKEQIQKLINLLSFLQQRTEHRLANDVSPTIIVIERKFNIH